MLTTGRLCACNACNAYLITPGEMQAPSTMRANAELTQRNTVIDSKRWGCIARRKLHASCRQRPEQPVGQQEIVNRYQ